MNCVDELSHHTPLNLSNAELTPGLPKKSWGELGYQFNQLASAISSFSLSSPELYISIRMSEPPMNSPLTYT